MSMHIKQRFSKNMLRIIAAAVIGALVGLIIKEITGLSVMILFACQILFINIELMLQQEAERKKQNRQKLK